MTDSIDTKIEKAQAKLAAKREEITATTAGMYADQENAVKLATLAALEAESEKLDRQLADVKDAANAKAMLDQLEPVAVAETVVPTEATVPATEPKKEKNN